MELKYKIFVKIGIVGLIIIVFIFSCMITNSPDELQIIYPLDSITAYSIIISNTATGDTQKIERKIIPKQNMQIDFWYNFYGNYFNTNYLKLTGRLFITKQYQEIYIKEIGYNLENKYYKLIDNEYFIIPLRSEYDIMNDTLVDENEEPILINGKNYYWKSVDFNKKIKSHFINGFLGQEKEIEVIQIYSFDNEPLREEKYKYRVICGGKIFDPMRLIIWMFPP